MFFLLPVFYGAISFIPLICLLLYGNKTKNCFLMSDCRLMIVDCRRMIVDCRTMIVDCRELMLDCRKASHFVER